ncbi:hypothetical protein LUZ62_088283 [Rhynchospora pubera]|uniref:Uncharacterized protein n=1 Tax=Rhynchospora pubera TaxID=906938 RepID=A0AAV8CIL9_9POAL|nr:hypothetical protein LUZ62_088283 [Rhynchospora pubera]
MQKQVLIVSLVVGGIGLISVILAVIAELTRPTKASNVRSDAICEYRGPAAEVALISALLLLVAQIIANSFSGCCGCCCRDSSKPGATGIKQMCAIIMAVVSWHTFTMSVLVLISCVIIYGLPDNHGQCRPIPAGGFAIGAIFAFITASLAILSYILFLPSADSSNMPIGALSSGTATGTPKFPPNQPQFITPDTNAPQYPPQSTNAPV